MATTDTLRDQGEVMAIPSPEQAQDLATHFGSQRAAARATGVPRTTLRHWLNPEKDRERKRRFYAENAEAECERQRERYWNLEGFAYTRRLHQIDMARRSRRMKEFQKRRDTLPDRGGPVGSAAWMASIVAEAVGEELEQREAS